LIINASIYNQCLYIVYDASKLTMRYITPEHKSIKYTENRFPEKLTRPQLDYAVKLIDYIPRGPKYSTLTYYCIICI